MMLDWLTALLATAGVLFFLAGALGLLRFPDTFSRLHALTKADNVGLGLVTAAVALQTASPWLWLKLVLIWGLIMLCGAMTAQLIARHVRATQALLRQEPSGGDDPSC